MQYKTIPFSEFCKICILPTKAIGWLKDMSSGDTFVLGKCVVKAGNQHYRAQAIIQKNKTDWTFTAIWQFRKLYDPSRIYTTGTLSFNDHAVLVSNDQRHDFSMFVEVLRRLEIHSSTLSPAAIDRYISNGFRPLYSCLWIGKDNLSKCALFVDGGDTPSRAKFKSSFIDVVMVNEQKSFDYFTDRPVADASFIEFPSQTTQLKQ